MDIQSLIDHVRFVANELDNNEQLNINNLLDFNNLENVLTDLVIKLERKRNEIIIVLQSVSLK